MDFKSKNYYSEFNNIEIIDEFTCVTEIYLPKTIYIINGKNIDLLEKYLTMNKNICIIITNFTIIKDISSLSNGCIFYTQKNICETINRMKNC